MKTQLIHSWPSFKIQNDWSLFLDRDGVINQRTPGDYVKKWEEFIFLPGVPEAIALLSKLFSRIFIVTNQAGIEKELMSHEDLEEIHQKMMECLHYFGGHIDEIYYCPYKPELDPFCRKPNPGMAMEAQKDFPEIEFKKSLMVGDSDSDIIFGNRLGMKTILVGDHNQNTFGEMLAVPDARMVNLPEVAQYFYDLNT